MYRLISILLNFGYV
ncbi:hypothetical protein F383_24172 [Gossypium arboreum]|uniref:Uncharacterized protein n=1 Tax=Gossypium arboreum TaxID=29729 RepID=A0A0B0P9Y1_GOSAR|nr:hypothetical protein F383_24172 [Gossypium arboreum]